MKTVLELFSEHALKADLKKGKSEALLVYAGRNAHRFYEKGKYGDGLAIKLPVDTAVGMLHVVKRYKHLGGIVHLSAAYDEEVARRARLGQAALTQITPALRTDGLTAQTKLNTVTG